MRPLRRGLVCIGLASMSVQAVAQDSADRSSTGLLGTIGLVSDYRFRGVSLSDRKPALQGGVEYARRSGLFVGAWASTLSKTSEADVELDLFAGASGDVAGLTYKVTSLTYLYPGQRGLSYVEVASIFEAPVGPATLGLELAYTPSQKNAVSNVYTAAKGELRAPGDITVLSRIGFEDGVYDRKWDWEVSISREFGPLTMQAAYIATNRRMDVGNEGEPTILATANIQF